MLKIRITTAAVLLAILIPIVIFRLHHTFVFIILLFFAASLWEALGLFGASTYQKWMGVSLMVPVLSMSFFVPSLFEQGSHVLSILFILCMGLWAVCLLPRLYWGLPANKASHTLIRGAYIIAITGYFLSVIYLFLAAPIYLLSVMTLVWIADIGAYFAGKAWGRHKLAPKISPGKSWEGVISGWSAAMLISSLSTLFPLLKQAFPAQLLGKYHALLFFIIITLYIAISIVGDLFESQLKRQANVKDSSQLLPGHGGVLDRIDALIPVLPLAAFMMPYLN